MLKNANLQSEKGPLKTQHKGKKGPFQSPEIYFRNKRAKHRLSIRNQNGIGLFDYKNLEDSRVAPST